MASRFRVCAHGLSSGDVVDFYDGDEFVASIYSTPGRSVRVISKPAMVIERDDRDLDAMVTAIEFAGLKQ